MWEQAIKRDYREKKWKNHRRKKDKAQVQVWFKGNTPELSGKGFFFSCEGNCVRQNHFMGTMQVIEDHTHKHLK